MFKAGAVGGSPTVYYSDSPSTDVLLRWLENRRINVNPSLRIVDMSDGSGLRILVDDQSPPLELGASLCTVPKSTVFSHRTASLSVLLTPPSEVYESPAICTLFLTACLLHELRLGVKSEWAGWLQILPRESISLPTFWEDEELSGMEGKAALEWIKGTSAEVELRRKEQEGLALPDLQAFFDEIYPFLPPTSTCPDPPSFADFTYAYSLVSSRGYVIDAYHIIGLVPFCDLFNHSSSSASTALLSNQGVCASCGRYGGCEYEPPSPSTTFIRTEGDHDVVEMRVEKRIQPGEEVLSCYQDDASNGKLLVEWGFVEDTTSADGVTWSPRDILTRDTIRPFTGLLPSSKLLAIPGETSRRVAPPSKTRPGMLNVYADGRASINLVIALALPHLTSDSELSLEELEASLEGVIAELESGDSTSQAATAVRQDLMTRLEDRLGILHMADRSIQDLQNVLSDMATTRYAERMALTLHMQERIILERALSPWTS